ncbi:ABC transporter ATP-binding protein [Fulvivirga sp. M361]|uniref:ABC transporter ATP-binding protein n=1 Tax=Fulvivirga sp. M361 TaxID=2594266 RepID=UPI0016291771
MIKVKNLSKSYDGRRVVNDVSFKVDRGQTLVLLGTSGSGKSTTLKMINRLIEKDQGNVWVNDQDIDVSPSHLLRRKIGYVIQQIGLFPHYSIAQNIALVPQLLGWHKARIDGRVNELLNLVGLEDTIKHRTPDQLSGGQQQRVGLARALASDPEIILMDEPFGALDPITRAEIQSEFKLLKKSMHKTVIIVTHDSKEAFELADRVALMNNGRIEQIGTPKELLFQPASDFVAQFFASHYVELELTAIKINELLPFLAPVEMDKKVSGPLPVDISVSEAAQHNRSGAISFSADKNDFIIPEGQLLPLFYANLNHVVP